MGHRLYNWPSYNAWTARLVHPGTTVKQIVQDIASPQKTWWSPKERSLYIRKTTKSYHDESLNCTCYIYTLDTLDSHFALDMAIYYIACYRTNRILRIACLRFVWWRNLPLDGICCQTKFAFGINLPWDEIWLWTKFAFEQKLHLEEKNCLWLNFPLNNVFLWTKLVFWRDMSLNKICLGLKFACRQNFFLTKICLQNKFAYD